MFAIIVEFDVAPEARAGFLPLMLENALRSAADEPGCLQFDVLEDGDGKVALYEVYVDEAAFAEHLRSKHYLAFAAASEPMVTGKTVRRLTLLGSNLHAA